MAFPSSQSFLPAAVRRGWGNPGKGMITWRKTKTETETETGGEGQRDRQGEGDRRRDREKTGNRERWR